MILLLNYSNDLILPSFAQLIPAPDASGAPASLNFCGLGQV